MNNGNILVEILENTKQVKNVVVEKELKIQKAKEEKAKKAKSAKSKAEAKFKMCGTKLNPEQQEILNAKIEKMGYKNYSQFFKMCVDFNFENDSELIERQSKTLDQYLKNNEILKSNNEILKSKIEKEEKKNESLIRISQEEIKKRSIEIEALKATVKQKEEELGKELNRPLYLSIIKAYPIFMIVLFPLMIWNYKKGNKLE